jgi:GrpB-like predicted nucleotidyltransferase (UPF0157 family)
VDKTPQQSDSEIAAVRIGPPDVLKRADHIGRIRSGLAAACDREAARIRPALTDRVLLIEHVGSTAVPRLAAQPRIDIVLAVADASDEACYVPALETASYVLHIG